MAGLVLMCGCIMGCKSTGHRKVTIMFLGTTISWEDDSTLKGEAWTSDVIAGSSLTEWAFGKTEPKDGVGDDQVGESNQP